MYMQHNCTRSCLTNFILGEQHLSFSLLCMVFGIEYFLPFVVLLVVFCRFFFVFRVNCTSPVILNCFFSFFLILGMFKKSQPCFNPATSMCGCPNSEDCYSVDIVVWCQLSCLFIVYSFVITQLIGISSILFQIVSWWSVL